MDTGTFSQLLKETLNNNMEGMYNYYQSRLNSDCFFNDDDISIINFFKNNIDNNKKIIEIAAGIGQVSHYLNKNNFNNITINEYDIKRFNLAKLINDKINNKCLLINDKYQNIKLSNYDYIFTMNAVSNHMNNNIGINLLKKALDKGSKVIMKEGYFGAIDDTTVSDILKAEYNYEIIFETNKKVYLFKK